MANIFMPEVVCVAAIQGNHLLLVLKEVAWFPPGGKREDNETDEKCIRREFSEELPKSHLSDLTPFMICTGLSPSSHRILTYRIYLGTVMGDITPSREIKAARWISNHELDSYHLTEGTEQLVASLRFTDRLT